jgi:hypothetical protein
MAKKLRELPYVYSEHLLPHDAEAREIGSGRSRMEQAEGLGIRPVRVVPRLAIDDGIAAVRAILARCYFDEKACQKGLNALRFYHKEYDSRGQTYRDKPAHDWSSHPSDVSEQVRSGHRGGKFASRVKSKWRAS